MKLKQTGLLILPMMILGVLMLAYTASAQRSWMKTILKVFASDIKKNSTTRICTDLHGRIGMMRPRNGPNRQYRPAR
jgi:hypothetical protein